MDILHYEDMISTRNATRPKFMALLRALLTLGVNLGNVMESQAMAFDLENAAGVQLDIIGNLVGFSRILSFMPTSGGRTLTDDEYRLMLRMKIAQNYWDGSNEGVFNMLDNLKEYGINMEYVDNMDMSVSFTVNSLISQRLADIVLGSGMLPVPAGMRCTFSVASNVAEIDAFAAQAIVTGEETYNEVEVQ